MDEDPATATLAEDYERFFVLMDYVRNRTRVDSLLALLEKDGKTYSICISDSYSYLATHMNLGGSLELFGVETEFLPPEDFLQPSSFQDGETRYMMRCLPFDLGGGDRLTLWSMLDMTDETQEHRQFLIRSMALNADPDAPSERLLANVRAAVDSFIGGAKQFDDLTMLCLEYRGPRANPEAEGDAP